MSESEIIKMDSPWAAAAASPDNPYMVPLTSAGVGEVKQPRVLRSSKIGFRQVQL